MRLHRLCPHAEEGRRAEQPPEGGVCEPRDRWPVSKYEVAPLQHHDQSRSNSLIEVLERVRSSTRLTITAQ